MLEGFGDEVTPVVVSALIPVPVTRTFCVVAAALVWVMNRFPVAPTDVGA